jgi:hypothetical protein
MGRRIAESCGVLFEDMSAVTELADFFVEAVARSRAASAG